MLETALITIAAALLLGVGLLGVLLPFVPGPPLAWLGLLVYGYGTGFEELTLNIVLWMFVLALATMIIELVAPILGAKRYQSSKAGILGATLGLLAGLIIGPFGILAGPMVGALIGELIAGKETNAAWRSAWGSFIGFLIGTVIKLAAVVVMIGYFIAALI